MHHARHVRAYRRGGPGAHSRGRGGLRALALVRSAAAAAGGTAGRGGGDHARDHVEITSPARGSSGWRGGRRVESRGQSGGEPTAAKGAGRGGTACG
eukprot:scaffold55494_cov75-Phaeocystis_antarctica.AAC.1